MNTTVADAIEAALATITREVAPLDEPLGYGRDLSCVTDISDTCEEVDPQSPQGIAEAICRRYISPRGSLIEDPDYGLDLRGLCNKGIAYEELRELADQAQAEAKKDDRVDHAEVTLDYDDTTSTLTVSVDLTPADPELGPFSFIFQVLEDGTPLLESVTS